MLKCFSILLILIFFIIFLSGSVPLFLFSEKEVEAGCVSIEDPGLPFKFLETVGLNCGDCDPREKLKRLHYTNSTGICWLTKFGVEDLSNDQGVCRVSYGLTRRGNAPVQTELPAPGESVPLDEWHMECAAYTPPWPGDADCNPNSWCEAQCVAFGTF